jgi:hypothetical protein
MFADGLRELLRPQAQGTSWQSWRCKEQISPDVSVLLLQALKLPSRHVEVNLHPTKREVGFLNQVRSLQALAHWLSPTRAA